LAAVLRARPLESRPDRDAGIIWFVTDLHSAKEYEIESDNDVGLAFIRAKVNAYLSITARAEVRRDHVTAAEIWKPTDNMWTAGTRFSPSRLLQRLTLRIGCWKNH
jgi:general stress protein 26